VTVFVASESTQFGNVVDLLYEGIALFDEQQRLVYANRSYAKRYSEVAYLLAAGTSFSTILAAATDDCRPLDITVGPVREVCAISGDWMRLHNQATVDGGVLCSVIPMESAPPADTGPDISAARTEHETLAWLHQR
jgi:hypothetical protein